MAPLPVQSQEGGIWACWCQRNSVSQARGYQRETGLTSYVSLRMPTTLRHWQLRRTLGKSCCMCYNALGCLEDLKTMPLTRLRPCCRAERIETDEKLHLVHVQTLGIPGHKEPDFLCKGGARNTRESNCILPQWTAWICIESKHTQT